MDIALLCEKVLWMLPLGFAVGIFGTLIGAGGGFILVPILLLVYPEKSADTITSISLAVVFFNALSGSCSYAKMKRIDYKSGLLFSCAVVPGAILGAINVAFISRSVFNMIFGIILIILSLFLIFKPELKDKIKIKHGGIYFLRKIKDATGEEYIYSYNPVTGFILSIGVGYLSSLLGIGGGIIHVPVLVQILNFPIHLATATSHFILAVMAFAGSIVHVVTGALDNGLVEALILSVGVIFGAPLGAKLSNRIHGKWIIRSLAIALGLVGIRILFTVI
ncbi:MAG: sulfite exporter TauE/SafE family protein [bacterium]|nr:sulfite exporter TauE/SafE family protein [bacterium]